jgi:hypothetical protein
MIQPKKAVVLGILSFLLHSIQTSSAPASSLIGKIQRVNQYTITGWACNPNLNKAPLKVEFYANGVGAKDEATNELLPSWSRYKGDNQIPDHMAGAITANYNNYDSSLSCGNAAHGFVFTISQEFRSRLGPGIHSIYVFTRDIAGFKPQVQLGDPIQITVTGIEHPVDSWYNRIAHDCRSWKDKAWQSSELKASYTFTQDLSCEEEYPQGLNFETQKFWVLESTNETANFSPVYDSPQATSDFPPLTTEPGYIIPMWNYSIKLRPSSLGYRVEWAIDKINSLAQKTTLDTYSGAFFQAELSTNSPQLSQKEVFLELWYRVRANEQAMMTLSDAVRMHDFSLAQSNQMLMSRSRFTVGIWFLGSDNIYRNIEVVLAKTENFDLCSSLTLVEGTLIPCEQGNRSNRNGSFYAGNIGLFDRRSAKVPIVYFNVEQLHQIFGRKQPSAYDRGYERVLIPINALLRNTPWPDSAKLPSRNGIVAIDEQELKSFYIGTEVWGKGRIWVEFERFNLFYFAAD